MKEEIVREYFNTLVEFQPTDVVDLLVKLFDKQIDYQEWIDNTFDDIIDSNN
jgi:hypothetical protein